MKKRLFFVLNFLLITVFAAQAQTSVPTINYFLPQENFTCNSQIPKPSDVLGFELTAQHATYEQVVNYMKALDAVSDRVSIETNGLTSEYRPLIFVRFTSKKNQDNVDNLITEHQKLSNPLSPVSFDTKNMPVFIWLGYSVHGNEASGMNASLAVAYFLAAAEGPEMDNILQNSVIVMQPSINPDGSNRFANWVNTTRSFTEVSDPSSREFSEPWPGSRSNHYWFDMNRDYLAQIHPESRARNEVFFKYRPNILGDYHEQGTNANYFFMPGIEARTNTITPSDNWELTRQVGEFHAKELDKIGTLYFTGESFDDFFYGKGSTFPDIHGTIAMLFEQASSRGHAQMSSNGVLRFAETVRNQAYCSYSTIRAAMAMRTTLLDHQVAAYANALKSAQKAPFQAYIFGTSASKTENYNFLQTLKRLRVDAYKLAKETKIGDKTYTVSDSYVVPLAQAEYLTVKTLFENVKQFRDSAFYDISAWTMTEAFNLQYSQLSSTNGYMGEKVDNPVQPVGKVIGGKANYAYIFKSNGNYYTQKLIYGLQDKGLRVRAAQRPFKYNGMEFGYGSAMISVTAQSLDAEQIYRLISELAAKSDVDVWAVNGGMASDITLGSGEFALLRKPEIAILVGQGASSATAGEIWHMFDVRLQIPASLIDNSRLDGLDLSKYNTLIVSGAHANLSKGAQEKLAAWVRDGGVMITTDNGWRLANQIGVTKIETVKEEAVKDEDKKQPQYRPYAELKTAQDGKTINGVILNCKLDISHPIAWGYQQDEIRVFRDGTTFFARPKDVYATPLSYTENPVVSGFVSNENAKKLVGTPSVMALAAGKGKVIVFADKPNFRAFWWGTNRLLLNAIFNSTAIRTARAE